MNKPFNEKQPPKNIQEFANNALQRSNTWIEETNNKYQISEKTNEAAHKAKEGIISFWAKTKQKFKDVTADRGEEEKK